MSESRPQRSWVGLIVARRRVEVRVRKWRRRTRCHRWAARVCRGLSVRVQTAGAAAGKYFAGQIDEVRIYDVVLGGEQTDAVYNQ